MHRRLLLVILLFYPLILTSCADGGPVGDRLQISVTFYPLQYVAERIADNNADVINITPAAADPHSLELSPKQVKAMGEADLIVHLSGGFQPAVDQALAVIGDVPKTDTAMLADGREGDPHFWLDPARLAKAGELVAQGMSEIDPANSALYMLHAQELTKELQELESEISLGLKDCQGATLVTSHEAFGYFADKYGLQQVGINGIDPAQEASPARLRTIAKTVAEQDVQTLFFEVAASDKMTRVLATDLNVNVAVLHSIERASENDDYLDLMHQNLDALESGLNCG